MSHFTTCKTELKDLNGIVAALYRIGYRKEQVKVNGKDVKVQGDGTYDRIEFNLQKDKSYQCRIDDTYKTKLAKITDYYTAEVVKAKAKEMHYSLTEEVEDSSGEITIRLHSPF